MNKISYLAWEPAFSVTVEHIDEQHRKLFDIVNDLIDEVQLGSNQLLPIIRDLVHYVSVHFHDENIVMMKSGYPGFDKHNQEHRQFTEKVGNSSSHINRAIKTRHGTIIRMKEDFQPQQGWMGICRASAHNLGRCARDG